MRIEDDGLFKRVHKGFFYSMLLILFMGLIALSSASVGLKSYAVSPILLRQLLWVGLGLGVYAVCMFLPLRTLEDATPILYTLGIALLMAVLIIGDATKGSRRWIELGILNFQPSEMMKLLMVLVIAKVLQKKDPEEALGVRGLLGPLTLIFIPVTLIILEPDLGTALSVLFVSGSLLLFFGVRKRLLMGLLALSVAIIPLGWLGLKDYQRERLLTFIDPSKDPLGSGYHILQSKIAVGSGGLSGKGFFQGTQSKLQFLPEKHTDFIFSVLAEEWGFLGSMALLCAYAMLLYHGLSIARTAKGSFLSLVAVGVLIGLFFQVLTNVGMVMGLMPVVGIPLPLVSYGGTSILMTMASLGILQNIHRSSFVFYA